jgi:hypothetical protein
MIAIDGLKLDYFPSDSFLIGLKFALVGHNSIDAG